MAVSKFSYSTDFGTSSRQTDLSQYSGRPGNSGDPEVTSVTLALRSFLTNENKLQDLNIFHF